VETRSGPHNAALYPLGEQSQDMMQGMKEMMARIPKMMDMCSQMTGNRSEPKKDESSK